MTVEERIETALEFMQLAEKELNAGDIRQGSEKLLGRGSSRCNCKDRPDGMGP